MSTSGPIPLLERARALLVPIARVLVYLVLAAPIVVGSQIGGGMLGHLFGRWVQPLFQAAVGIAGILLLTRLMWTNVERRAWPDIGLPRFEGPRFLGGLAIGATCIIAVALVELAFGWLEVRGFDLRPDRKMSRGLLLLLAMFPSLGVGFTEELAFRGYIFGTFAARFSPWVAAVVSASLWASVHFMLGGFGLGFVITVTAMGVLLVGLRILTGSLWLPIGFHSAWDYCQTYLVGLSTFGTAHDPSLVPVNQLGPVFWVGSPPAIEGGALFTILIALGLASLGYTFVRDGGRRRALRPSRIL